MGINIEYKGGNSRPSASKDKYIGLVWGISVCQSERLRTLLLRFFRRKKLRQRFCFCGKHLARKQAFVLSSFNDFKLSPLSVIQLYLTTTITIDDLNVFDSSTQLLGYFTGTQAVDTAGVVTLVNSAQTKLFRYAGDG